MDTEGGLRRQLGWLDAAAIFVGIILGSGIFVAPSDMARLTASPLLAVGLWVLGATVAACGAFCYAECGARLPRTGGFFAFYKAAYGEPVAFVGGWAALLITYPASLAAISHIFARYMDSIAPGAASTPIRAALVAGAAVTSVAGLNVLGVRAGAGVQRVLTAVKVLALAALCGAAALAPVTGAVELQPIEVVPTWPEMGALLGALISLLWTYDGWSDVTLVSGELRDPARDLGRAVLRGILVLVVTYALVQVAVMLLLPAQQAASSRQVVADAVEAGLGPRVARAVAVLVVISTLGSLNGTVLAASRIAFAMAREGVFFRWFGEVQPTFGTPARSTLVLLLTTLAYVAVSDFRELLGIFSFNVWIFYATTAVALLVLRRRRVGEPIAWRAPGGLVPPIVVLTMAVVITGGSMVQSWKRSLLALGILLAGVPVYLLWRALSARRIRKA
jgi:APA family basic amino acid/polyamine antiporter